MGISAVLITLNEEKNLRDCLDSVMWTDEIIVVDGGSVDKTVKIAEEFKGKVFYNEFVNFSSQKNFALEKASEEWILFLDADERISEGLKAEIKDAVNSSEFQGYYIPRKNITLLCVSRFQERKKNDLLLHTVKSLNEKYTTNFKLKLVAILTPKYKVEYPRIMNIITDL